jgi:hypothetical protein
MVETTLINNTNVLNVAILPILNGIVPSTIVEPADKQHLDMHQKPVQDVFLMTESADIMKLRNTKITTSPESVDVHMLFMYVYLFNYLN